MRGEARVGHQQEFFHGKGGINIGKGSPGGIPIPGSIQRIPGCDTPGSGTAWTQSWMSFPASVIPKGWKFKLFQIFPRDFPRKLSGRGGIPMGILGKPG